MPVSRIQFDLDEAAGDGGHHAFVAEVVLRDPDQPRAREPRHGHPRDIVDVFRGLLAGVAPAEFDGAPRGGGVGHRPGGVLRGEHRLVADFVVLRRAAQVHGGDRLEFLQRVHGGHVVGAGAGEGGVAAGLGRRPGQVAAAVAPLDDAVVPAVLEYLRRDPGGGGVGVRAEVAAAGVDVQHAVGRDPHQAIVAVAAGGMVALADPDADDLRPVALAAAGRLLLPVEEFGALGQRFVLVGAGDGALAPADLRVVARRVDAPYGQLVDAQFARGLVEDRLDGLGDLVLPRAALGSPRRRVGFDGIPR